MSDSPAPSLAPAPALSVSPAPTDEEMAAIAAAYQALWPKPSSPQSVVSQSATWRFSARWFETTKFPARRR